MCKFKLYRQEGIIIKKPSSKYVLNERIDDWVKIKPEYLDALGDSLDLLIVGKFFRHCYKHHK